MIDFFLQHEHLMHKYNEWTSDKVDESVAEYFIFIRLVMNNFREGLKLCTDNKLGLILKNHFHPFEEPF